FRFLNGQITNDLRKVSETVAIEACVLNAKGKMDAHIFVGALGESFLVDAETGVREKLRARLERYIIADDVEIQDVTNQFSLFRFLNGQITNDLRKVSETVAIEACVLNAKGKMDAHIFVGALGESFLVDAETGVREKLRARLERYIIADDVEIQDVTNQFSLF